MIKTKDCRDCDRKDLEVTSENFRIYKTGKSTPQCIHCINARRREARNLRKVKVSRKIPNTLMNNFLYGKH